jgi:hypothetical protein
MTTESQQHEFKVGSPAELLVKNIRGDVQIVPGADDLIKVEVITYPDDGNAADTRIELTQEPGGRVRAEVTVPDKGFRSRRPLRVDFRIEAPVHTDIKTRLVSGSVHARGFKGRADLGTVSGKVEAEDLDGRLDLDSVSGKITGSGLKGEASVSVVSGRIRLRGCDFPALKLSTVSGRAEVETQFGDGPYKLSAVSGSLLLVVPEGSSCHVDASAVSGKFYTDLDVRQSLVSKRRWQVQIGEGGPEVRVKTVSGRMQLLSSFDARGRVPGVVVKPRKDRKEILSRLSEGQISVEEAMEELAP